MSDAQNRKFAITRSSVTPKTGSGQGSDAVQDAERTPVSREPALTVSPTQEEIDPRAFAKSLLTTDKEIMDYLAR
jgi:hypothetical protein